MKNFLKSSLFSSLILIVFGMILLFSPGSSLIILCQIIGWALFLAGAVGIAQMIIRRKTERPDALDIVKYGVAALAGLVFLLWPQTLAVFVPTIAGIAFVLNGIISIIRGIQMKKDGGSGWIVALVCAVITVIFGALILANPFSSMKLLVGIIGASMIYNGALNFWISYRMKK